MHVTTGMASDSTRGKMPPADAGQRRTEKPDPGHRPDDAAPRRARPAPGAARAQADLAVHGPASVDRAPHPLLDVRRSTGGPRRAGQLSPGHAPARAWQPREV